MRKCNGPCGKTLPLDDFYPKKKPNGWTGHSTRCKKCDNAYTVKIRDPERTLAARRRWERKHGKEARRNLPDWYVRARISNRTSLSARDIPIEMVEMKRAQMLLKRELKKTKRKRL